MVTRHPSRLTRRAIALHHGDLGRTLQVFLQLSEQRCRVPQAVIRIHEQHQTERHIGWQREAILLGPDCL